MASIDEVRKHEIVTRLVAAYASRSNAELLNSEPLRVIARASYLADLIVRYEALERSIGADAARAGVESGQITVADGLGAEAKR